MNKAVLFLLVLTASCADQDHLSRPYVISQSHEDSFLEESHETDNFTTQN